MHRPPPLTKQPIGRRRGGPRTAQQWAVAAIGAAALALTAGPVSATIAETTHFTGNLHESAANPCTGATGTLDVTFVGVSHTTINTDGTGHHIATVHGTEAFAPDDPDLVSYSGGFTARDGQNGAPGQTITSTGTFHNTLTGSDGSKIRVRGVFHVTTRGDGSVTSSVDRVTLTCP